SVQTQDSEQPSRKEQRYNFLFRILASEDASSEVQQWATKLLQDYAKNETTDSKSALYVLICVCYELDCWLLSDNSVLQLLASSPEHPAENPGFKNPEQDTRPSQ